MPHSGWVSNACQRGRARWCSTQPGTGSSGLNVTIIYCWNTYYNEKCLSEVNQYIYIYSSFHFLRIFLIFISIWLHIYKYIYIDIIYIYICVCELYLYVLVNSPESWKRRTAYPPSRTNVKCPSFGLMYRVINY